MGSNPSSDEKWQERQAQLESAEAELRKQEHQFSESNMRFEYLKSLFSVPFRISDDDFHQARMPASSGVSVNVVELQESLLRKREVVFVDDKLDALPVAAERLLLIQILRARATACLTHISELLVDEINSAKTQALLEARDAVVGELSRRLSDKNINKELGSQLTHDARKIWPSHFGTTQARTDLLLAFTSSKETFDKLKSASMMEG